MNNEFLNVILTRNSFLVEYKGKDEILLKEYYNFLSDKYKTLYELNFFGEQKYFNTELNFLIKSVNLIVKLIVNDPLVEIARENIVINLNEDFYNEILGMMPFMLNDKYVSREYINNLFDKMIEIYKKEISNSSGSVKSYFNKKDENLNVASRIYFHLVENTKDENGERPFAFMATYAKKENKECLHTPLKKALIEFKDDQNKLIYLLSAVTKASEKSELIKKLVDSREIFSPTYFTAEEAYIFFKEISFYESIGIMCRIPKWQRTKKNSATIKLEISKKSSFNLTTLLSLNPQIYIDDEVISAGDLQEILNSESYLTKYKNKWINTSKDELKKILKSIEILEQNNEKKLTLFELMRLEFNPNKNLGIEDDVLMELGYNQWYENFKKELANPNLIKDVEPPKSLNAKLRGYQQIGYNWLSKMLEYGLGACLADDMGLGKTLQIITLLTKIYEDTEIKTLLVVPSSLMMNWKKEFNKFSNLEPVILHNNAGVKLENFVLENKVYITSYKLAGKLKDYEFDMLIIDEAQAIKNVGAEQTKTIKAIQSTHKIALTGTPIENNLADLYSLFDFLNKGLLGSQKEFVKKANKYVADDNFKELRTLVKPFILRRLKSDKNIINDLPDKLEFDKYVDLSDTQVLLYKKEIENLQEELNKEEIPKGLVLNYIMKFKQICNHPSQFLNDGIYNEFDSGKFGSLKIIANTVKDNHEQMIVFTQFKEMTEPINNFLKKIFGQEGLVIHGSTSIVKRDQYVTKFNSEEYVPYIVLSLKAGGTGLNLVSANHVVHFDRWWNPAVENQATDRAYRIGQNKNVNVYKFICTDTVEEKIDEIIKSKQLLSDNVLKSSGEAWITKFNKEEILNLFKYERK